MTDTSRPSAFILPTTFSKAIAAHDRFIAEANAAKEAKPNVVEFTIPISAPMAMAINAGRAFTAIRAINVMLDGPKDWCADECRKGWHMSELAVRRWDDLVYDFRFESMEDAALFKMWWS